MPDLLACYRERFLGIEVKRFGGGPTLIQIHELESISYAGGIVAVAHSLAEVEQMLTTIDDDVS